MSEKMSAEEIVAAFGQIRKLCADAGVWRLTGSSWDHADRLEAHIATLQREADEAKAEIARLEKYCVGWEEKRPQSSARSGWDEGGDTDA